MTAAPDNEFDWPELSAISDPANNGAALTTETQAESPVFLDAYQFAARETEPPLPLWGSPETCVLAAGGLALLAGRPGSGKTTWILDFACHLAAGLPYPPRNEDNGPDPWPVPRPLRIALIENEGPQEMFRLKLADKLKSFPHNICGNGGLLMIQEWRWGAFSFADPDARARAMKELDEHAIDLVLGDPLASLGPGGVGSPADTRDFVALLRPLGLGISRAFMFLHHFRERVEKTEDELARISGAWGGHLDTLLTLSATSKAEQARLAYPKLRWSRRRPPNPIILGRIWDTASYEIIGEEGDTAILEPHIYEHLAAVKAKKGGRKGQGWQTSTEIAKEIETRRVDVTKTCEAAPHLFVCMTGQDAKALGAKASAKLWGLAEWINADTEPPDDDQPF